MSVLHELAQELGTHERTLRRGLSGGLLKGHRPSARRVELVPGEVGYVRRHWPLLAALREALRKAPNVRLAVLVGSAARGQLRDGSDIDLVVDLADASWRAEDVLRTRLAAATGRSVDLIPLQAAKRDPLLFEALLRDGRVLADRDGTWPSLAAERAAAAAAARRASDGLRSELHALVAELSEPDR